MEFLRKEETLFSGEEISKLYQVVNYVQAPARKYCISHQRIRQVAEICKAYFLFVQSNPESSLVIELNASTVTSFYDNGQTGPSTQLSVKSEAKTITAKAIRFFRDGNSGSGTTILKMSASNKDYKLVGSSHTPKIGRLIEPFIEFLQIPSISFNGSYERVTLEADCLSTKPISL